MQIRDFIRVGEQRSPESKPRFVPVGPVGCFRRVVFGLGDRLRRGGLLAVEIEARGIPHPFGNADVQLLPLRLLLGAEGFIGAERQAGSVH